MLQTTLQVLRKPRCGPFMSINHQRAHFGVLDIPPAGPTMEGPWEELQQKAQAFFLFYMLAR